MLPPGKATEQLRVCPDPPFRPAAVTFEYVVNVDEDDLPSRLRIVTNTATPSDHGQSSRHRGSL